MLHPQFREQFRNRKLAWAWCVFRETANSIFRLLPSFAKTHLLFGRGNKMFAIATMATLGVWSISCDAGGIFKSRNRVFCSYHPENVPPFKSLGSSSWGWKILDVLMNTNSNNSI